MVSKLEELMNKRYKTALKLEEIERNSPEVLLSGELAALDKAIDQARIEERKEQERKAALEAEKRKESAKVAYYKVCSQLLKLSDALEELAPVRKTSPANKIPRSLDDAVKATIDHLKRADPTALNLPPRPTEEEMRKTEERISKERRSEMVKHYKELLKGATGAARNDLEKTLAIWETTP